MIMAAQSAISGITVVSNWKMPRLASGRAKVRATSDHFRSNVLLALMSKSDVSVDGVTCPCPEKLEIV